MNNSIIQFAKELLKSTSCREILIHTLDRRYGEGMGILALGEIKVKPVNV